MKWSLWCVLVFALLGSTGCSATDHDFNSVVSSVEQRYSVHAQRIPLMGLISLCATAKTEGGVKGMRIAEFDRIGELDPIGLFSLMQSQLGTQWQPMVMERSAARSSLSVIFVRPSETSGPSDHSMVMMIANYEHGKLDLVRMKLNGSALALWIKAPQAHVQRAMYPGNSSGRQTD